MALDKLVDSAQLGSDLTSVADAIRAKGGTSAQLAFPAGFVDAVDAIETGGGGVLDKLDDFTGGNILAIIGHGTEFIQTDLYPTMCGFYGAKLQDSSSTPSYEHYWGAADSTSIKRIGIQRSGSSGNLQVYIAGSSLVLSPSGYSAGNVAEVMYSSFGATTGKAKLALCLFRGYYRNALEAKIATATFYGLNIVDENLQLTSKIVPWLENGVACVKDLVSGTIYQNSGSGAFDYIDLNGVTHVV